MHSKVKNKLTAVMIILCFFVMTAVSVTAIFALTQHFFSTEMDIDYKAPSIKALTFTENTDGLSYSITACDNSMLDGTSGEIVIPTTYNGKPVTKIEGAFLNCDGIISINIPESITIIDARSFYGCSNLNSVNFQNPNYWFVSSISGATNGTELSSVDLSNPTSAAEFLTDTYCDKYWGKINASN